MSGSSNRPGGPNGRRSQTPNSANDRLKKAPKKSGEGALARVGRVIGTFFLIGLTTAAILAVIAAVYISEFINSDLDINPEDFSLDLTSFVYYYDKDAGDYKVLDELYYSNRIWARYDEIPEHLIQAVIAIEDHRFLKHNGVDWYRTTAAFFNMFLGMRDNFGGSTLTQQLIKNLTDEDDITVRRKITEIFRALEFEKSHSKEDILEWYLNLVYFGQGANGIQAAAHTYFGKDVGELTLAESAAIVGITNAPTRYDPYQNRDLNKKRQENILFAMYEQEIITEAEYDAACDEPLVFRRDAIEEEETSSSVQSWFVDQVISDVIRDLAEEKGISTKVAERLVYSAGYHIYTTIDLDVQAAIDEVYTNPDYWPALRNTGGFQPQSAIVVMDPYTGDIVGMAGGLGEKTQARVFNRAASAVRQPGSSIKPIGAYAPAIDAGLITPYSVLTNMPVYTSGGTALPKNSTFGRSYTGQMTVMKAVEVSNNTIPARLVTDMTPQRAFDFAKYSMGLSTLVEKQEINGSVYSDISVAPLSLGGMTRGVTVRDMAAAYSVFPNGGGYNEARTYSVVRDSDGHTVLDNSVHTVPVIKETTAHYMNVLLKNVMTGPNGTGVNARVPGMTIAGKTGTTDDEKDRWFAGYSPYYTCVVWFGFDTPRKINPVSGTSSAVPLWKEVMVRIHEGLEDKDFFEPTGKLVSAAYCLDSGLQPTEACRSDPRGSRVATGSFFSEHVPQQACHVHQYVSVDSTTGQLATPYCPAENLARVAMLALDRRFEIPGIVVGDEQYTIRYFSDPLSLQGTGYRVQAAGNSEGALKNSFCIAHTDPNWQAEVSPSPSDDPDAPPTVPPGIPTPPGYSPPPDNPGSTVPPADTPPVTHVPGNPDSETDTPQMRAVWEKFLPLRI